MSAEEEAVADADAIVEDAREEMSVMLNEWRNCNEGPVKKQMFLEEF